ncbi:MAG: hypothetical protein KBT11_09195 [Treponema sp.]|nr:hypothetical protein [Candidatus Treponema equifaecale]
MEKTILFAGKELPDGNDLASGASFQGRKVIATCSARNSEDDNPNPMKLPNGIRPVVWNRGSVLSSRSLVLNCENEGGVDEAVLVFDEALYAEKFGSAYENARILEELIGCYQYLAQEIISRFARNEGKKSKVVFLYKSNPTISESVVSNSLKISGAQLSYSLIAAAGGAFRSFAENMAAELVSSQNITPLLVNCDYSNDLAGRDNSLAVWLCDYMDAVDALKKPLTPKQKLSWIKAGDKKPSNGFGLF